MTTRLDPRYAGYRYPAEIIATAVWLYVRFPLSLRMVEDLLAARGITVSYETVRQWARKFGPEIAARLRRRAPRRGDKWHLDEVVLTIGGRKHYLWRAVDQDGFVLDVLVQSRRDTKAAKRLLRKLLKKQGRALWRDNHPSAATPAFPILIAALPHPDCRAIGIVAAREDRPYASVDDLWHRAGVPVAALRLLAAADAFTGLGLTRRAAAWAIRALRDEALPLFAAAGAERDADEPVVTLRPMSAGRELVDDYTMTGLSLRGHPVALLRQDLRGQGIIACADLARTRDGRRVTVSGLVLVRQRPGSANGVLFITLEAETGIANVIVWKKLFEQQRRIILGARMMAVTGRVQIEGDVIHLIADRLTDHTDLLRSLEE